MPDIDLTKFKTLIRRKWSEKPDAKVERYVGTFFDRTRTGAKIVARTQGNHGTYTVSMEVVDNALESACSCYIGAGGYCHHCEALARTYLQDPAGFTEIVPPQLEEVKRAYYVTNRVLPRLARPELRRCTRPSP